MSGAIIYILYSTSPYVFVVFWAPMYLDPLGLSFFSFLRALVPGLSAPQLVWKYETTKDGLMLFSHGVYYKGFENNFQFLLPKILMRS